MSIKKKFKIETASVSTYDVEELACKITGLDYDEIDADEAKIEDALQEKFEISIGQFADIVRHLLPLVDVGYSPLTDTRYKGFADTEKQMWLVKMEVQIPKKKK